MRSYHQNSRSSGGRRGGGDFRRRDSGPREMHQAICDKCGQSCEVPFKPSGDKPIFCSNCFERKDGGGQKSPRRSGFGDRDNTNKQLLEQVSSLNEKLDRILQVLESSLGKKKVTPKTS